MVPAGRREVHRGNKEKAGGKDAYCHRADRQAPHATEAEPGPGYCGHTGADPRGCEILDSGKEKKGGPAAADHTPDAFDSVSPGQATALGHQDLSGPLEQKTHQKTCRQEGDSKSSELNREREIRAGESPGKGPKISDKQDIQAESGGKGGKGPANRRFLWDLESGADHCADGRPQKPDGHGQDVYQLHPVQRHIQLAEQDDLSHDRNEADGKQGKDHGWSQLSLKTWAWKV